VIEILNARPKFNLESFAIDRVDLASARSMFVRPARARNCVKGAIGPWAPHAEGCRIEEECPGISFERLLIVRIKIPDRTNQVGVGQAASPAPKVRVILGCSQVGIHR